MSEGKSLRVQDGWIEKYFQIDSYGSLFPVKTSLRTKEAAAKVSAQLSRDSQLARDMRQKIFSTDVEFAYRPLGSTPVIASGIPMFKPTPLRRLRFSGKIGDTDVSKRENKEFLNKCAKREKKIEAFMQDAWSTLERIEPTDEIQKALLDVEFEQVHTGGGYDNTKMFSITGSLLGFLQKCAEEVGEPDGELSAMLMRHITSFKRELWSQLGIAEGTLRTTSFMLVRLMQESDGMIGYPVFAKSSKELTKDIALRLSVWSGVDCRHLVGVTVKGKSEEGSVMRTAQVVDAMCYVLDNMLASPSEDTFDALIWTLARIQRHGYTVSDGTWEAKKGKARSVSPNAALSGSEEAMSGDPVIKKFKEAKVPWMPSLQDRETADALIWNWYEKVLVPNEMRALPADWSGYDKTVKGWILATILYHVIRPLYHFDDQKWFDLAIVSLVFKYFFISRTAAEAHPEEWADVQSKFDVCDIDDDLVLVGTWNGLGSGAKLTHVGGSLYGELLIHHCIPEMLGYEGVSGPQAGDDTSLAIPMSMIDLTSAEKTYAPIAAAASKWGLEMNTSKQMWVVGGGEVVNIFLQYAYNWNLQIKGVGTAVRYYVAYPFAEREKFLTIGEQYMAIISKFQNGITNPWIETWIEKWLGQDPYVCALFKEYGDRAFDILVESIGASLREVSKRLELTYNWGMKKEDLESRNIPIVPVIAEVASRCSPGVTAAEAMRKLELVSESERQRSVDQEGWETTAAEAYGVDDDDDVSQDSEE